MQEQLWEGIHLWGDEEKCVYCFNLLSPCFCVVENIGLLGRHCGLVEEGEVPFDKVDLNILACQGLLSLYQLLYPGSHLLAISSRPCAAYDYANG